MKQQKVCIYDIKTGDWELNILREPLINSYTHGMTAVIPVRKNVQIGSTAFTEGILLSAPSWFQYIKFGLSLLLWKIKKWK